MATQKSSGVDAARELLQTIVASLGGSPAAIVTDPSRLFFPAGIGLISIDVDIGGAKVAIKIASDPKASAEAQETPAAPQTGLLALAHVAESCREALHFDAGTHALSGDLVIGEKVPASSEAAACGAIAKKIVRTDPEFGTLVANQNPAIVFKDEEGTGADRVMTPRLRDTLNALAEAVAAEWSGVRLRVTEAWDEDNEHTGNSLHYEGRAADLTTAPIDATKLGRLGRLAVDAGFDWVWYENAAHVHVSVKK